MLWNPNVTPLERETIRKLRNSGGWWEGDENALKILREYADGVRVEKEMAKEP